MMNSWISLRSLRPLRKLGWRLSDKCHHIVNVKKCQEIVNKTIVLALCPASSETYNARFWGDTGGETHGHNHRRRPLEVYLQGETFTMWWHFSVFTMC
jgi:hypothetical protein